MTALPSDPVLADWARWLENVGWAAFILDPDYTVVWVSDEMAEFAHESDSEALGIGRHLVSAFFDSAWSRQMTPESQVAVFQEIVPLVAGDPDLKRTLLEVVPDELRAIVEEVEPQPMPYFWSSSFGFIRDELEPYKVNFAFTRIHDDSGKRLGAIFTSFMDVRPNLFVLLARGNQEMYERMASLVEPRRRQGAVLFADLEASAQLSRQLPTVQYFKLIRSLSTTLDEVVATNHGVIGKHAGDGATAFFLSEHLGSPSKAALAAITAARQMQQRISELPVSLSGEAAACVLNVGIHWGAGLFMGQLVPGGRLDVTALGDEVNECARIQESTRSGDVLASKALVEQLTDDDAAEVGLDPEKLVYAPLGDVPTASDKAKRDAGTLAVTAL